MNATEEKNHRPKIKKDKISHMVGNGLRTVTTENIS